MNRSVPRCTSGDIPALPERVRVVMARDPRPGRRLSAPINLRKPVPRARIGPPCPPSRASRRRFVPPDLAVDKSGRARPPKGGRVPRPPGRPRPDCSRPVQGAPPLRLRAHALRRTARPKQCFGLSGRDPRAKARFDRRAAPGRKAAVQPPLEPGGSSAASPERPPPEWWPRQLRPGRPPPLTLQSCTLLGAIWIPYGFHTLSGSRESP